MVLEYFTSKKSKRQSVAETPKTPVLSEEDELFLHKITSAEAPPPLPARPIVILDNGATVEGKDAQVALMDGADKVPLPLSPPVEAVPIDKKGKGKEKDNGDADKKKKRDYWGFIPNLPTKFKGKNKEKAADDIKSAADALKTTGGADIKPGDTPGPEEAKKEEEDLTAILDQLNLAAVNNRVFSFSKESQELLDKFKLILKDIINGVPTAYNDLEQLLKSSEKQIKTMFAAMPPFLQALVKSLPKKMSQSLGPEVLAASAEKPSLSTAATSAAKASKRSAIPNLKSLVSSQGAVVTMLRSIVNFLKLRFPAVLAGTNVILSLAVFLLLFVFWYCWKRGRETRLEKERLAAESGEISELSESDASALDDSGISEILKKESQAEKSDPGPSDSSDPILRDLPSVLDLPDPVMTPLPPTPQPKAEEKLTPAPQPAK